MAKPIIVKGDPVNGTDKHNVAGPDTSAPPVPGKWVGDFDYVGSMTDQLSDFVKIGGQPAALVSSKSSLKPGEAAPPAGRHSGPLGKNFTPPAPAPSITPATPAITDPIGTGIPNAAAGSSFVSIGGAKALLDGDKIDTCDGLGVPANSTVRSQGQDFVSCSG